MAKCQGLDKTVCTNLSHVRCPGECQVFVFANRGNGASLSLPLRGVIGPLCDSDSDPRPPPPRPMLASLLAFHSAMVTPRRKWDVKCWTLSSQLCVLSWQKPHTLSNLSCRCCKRWRSGFHPSHFRQRWNLCRCCHR